MAISIAIVIFIFFPLVLLITRDSEKAFVYSIYAIIGIFIIAIGAYFGPGTMMIALIIGVIIYCRCSE